MENRTGRSSILSVGILLVSAAVVAFMVFGGSSASKTGSEEKKFIAPTASEWLFANGQWKEVATPDGEKVMQGWMDGKNGRMYGRRAKIKTDSPFAALKQRGIGGTVNISVDGKETVSQKLEVDGKPVNIPIYKNKKGWHEIEISFTNLSEIDGLYISADSKVRKPEENRERLVVIGDSHADGSGAKHLGTEAFATLLGDMLNMESINQGIGRTDIDLSAPSSAKNSGLERVGTDIAALEPDYILSVYGFNSISMISGGKKTHEQYEQKYIEFLQAIQKALPETKVFASGIIATPTYSDEELLPYNADIKNACSKVENCTYIDLAGTLNEGNFAKYLAPDKIHLGVEGHKYMAEIYAKAIKQ